MTYLPAAERVSSFQKLTVTVARSSSLALIVAGGCGGILLATIGVSAHMGFIPVFQAPAVQQTNGDGVAIVASVALEASPKLEPTEKPQPTPAATLASQPAAAPSPKSAAKLEAPDGDDGTAANAPRTADE